ncbi:hypothetical protein AXW82_02270 [Mycoplasmopsis canis PG 14]|uniref:Lipoprotein n=1 Tax=Mycoplasmopsis canis TaxID=29555 RepID=A0A449AQ32_9BACT|nr:hypothetical protein [Mycoplasmopsis canis]AMD81364.1 hypothetical protein AXW82_02270 [Mycoplasmopsis canis PG 14]VEU68658.1 Uncharacterised protein [Mycoplasmopsis canis]
MYKKLKLLSIITSTTLPLFISVSCNSIQNDTKKENNSNNQESSNTNPNSNATNGKSTNKDEINKNVIGNNIKNENGKEDNTSNPEKNNSKEGVQDLKKPIDEPKKQDDTSVNDKNKNNTKPSDKETTETHSSEVKEEDKFNLEEVYINHARPKYPWDETRWQKFLQKGNRTNFQKELIYYRLTGNTGILNEEKKVNPKREVIEKNTLTMNQLIWGQEGSSSAESSFNDFSNRYNNTNSSILRKMIEEIYFMIKLTLNHENLYNTVFNNYEIDNSKTNLRNYIKENYNQIKQHQKGVDKEILVVDRGDGSFDLKISKDYIVKTIDKIVKNDQYLPYYYELIIIYYYLFNFVSKN